MADSEFESGMKKITVILGAGASHDVHGQGSALKSGGKFRPPLAKELFDIDERNEFAPYLAKYPGAAHLAQTLGARVSGGEVAVEDLLRQMAESNTERDRNNFKQIPLYLCDILFKASVLIDENVHNVS